MRVTFFLENLRVHIPTATYRWASTILPTSMEYTKFVNLSADCAAQASG